MELNPQAKAFRKRILTEREVRQMTHALKRALGEPIVSISKQYGLSVADGIRFMAVSAHLVEAREAKGLTLKMLAKELKAPQFRVAEIERGSPKHVDASLLGRYIDAMGLREWYSRWESANRGLAKRLAVLEAGNLQRVPAGSHPERTMRKERRSANKIDSAYELKVTLLHSRPPIWRRFQLESSATLEKVHLVLQIVMGWTDSHMHGFRIPQPGQRGARRRFLPIEDADEKSIRLAGVLRRPQDRLVYDYDFGDGWEHELVLEAIVPRSATVRYPHVLAGRRACPPDDVGGIPGYHRFLEAIKDPRHPDHADMVEWGGTDFDPARFDVQAVNREFHGGWGPRRPDA